MNASARDAREPRRRPRLACLGLVAIAALIGLGSAVLFGFAWLGMRNETVESEVVQLEVAPTADAAGNPALPTGALRVVLEFAVGEFVLRRGSPGEPVRVAGEFDHRSYTLEDSFEPGPPGAGTYRLRFYEIGWVRDGGLRVLFGGHRPKLTVFLPPDVPIELVGRFGKGGANVELGGLWLTDIDIEIAQGGGHIGIDEPLVAPVGRLRIHTRKGGFSTERLGNASPRRLEFDSAFGAAEIDLRGAWLQDAEVTVRQWVGSANLTLPSTVDVVAEGVELPARLALTPGGELPRSQMRLSVSHGIGSLQVD